VSLVLEEKTHSKGWKVKIHGLTYSWHYAAMEDPLRICSIHHKKLSKPQVSSEESSYKLQNYNAPHQESKRKDGMLKNLRTGSQQ